MKLGINRNRLPVQPDVPSGYPEYQHFKCEKKIYGGFGNPYTRSLRMTHPQGRSKIHLMGAFINTLAKILAK